MSCKLCGAACQGRLCKPCELDRIWADEFGDDDAEVADDE